MSETILWGWEHQNDGITRGTFESRDEAIKDALESLRPGEKRTIEVGHIKELEAADYVTVDSDEILEQAAQECWDQFNYDGDRPFDFVSTEIIPEAVQELHKFMREWATKYLYNVDGFYVLENAETVELSNGNEDCGSGCGVGGDGDDDDYDDSEDDEDSDEEDERDEEEEEDEGKEKE